MRRGDLADLTAFVAVADMLSFRAASERLGVTASALSHTIQQLEERLGARLLQRSTRSVSLTDAGSRLLERLRPAMEQIAGALDDLDPKRCRPSGRLRVYATSIAAATVVAPVWTRFLMTYPEVQLELEVGYAAARHRSQGFDAGIGPGRARRGGHGRRACDRTDEGSGGRRAIVLRATARAADAGGLWRSHSCIHCAQLRNSSDRSVVKWEFEGRHGTAADLASTVR